MRTVILIIIASCLLTGCKPKPNTGWTVLAITYQRPDGQLEGREYWYAGDDCSITISNVFRQPWTNTIHMRLYRHVVLSTE